MIIETIEPQKQTYRRTYPCLLKHIGLSETGHGNIDWKGVIVFALSDMSGCVIVTTPEFNKLNMPKILHNSFSGDHWVDYFGVVTLDNRLPMNTVEPDERRLDPQL